MFVVIVAVPSVLSVAVATVRLFAVFTTSTSPPFTGVPVFSSVTIMLMVVLSIVLLVIVAVVVEFRSTTSTVIVFVLAV